MPDATPTKPAGCGLQSLGCVSLLFGLGFVAMGINALTEEGAAGGGAGCLALPFGAALLALAFGLLKWGRQAVTPKP